MQTVQLQLVMQNGTAMLKDSHLISLPLFLRREDVLQHVNSEQLSRIILEKDDAEALLLWASRYSILF